MRAAKFALAYGIGRVGQSAYGLQEASGFEASNWQKYAMNVGQGAMAGAAFGPAGAAIGAGLGLVQSALDYWTESLKKSVEALDEWNKSVKEASEYRKARKEYSSSKALDDAIEQSSTGDKSKLFGLRTDLSTRASELKKLLEVQDKNAKSGEVASNAMEMLRELQATESKIKTINATLDRIDKAEKLEAERKEKQAKDEADRIEKEQKDLAKARERYSDSEYLDQLVEEKDVKGLSTAALGYKIQMDNATSLESYTSAQQRYAAAQSALKGLNDTLIDSVLSNYKSQMDKSKDSGAYDTSINAFSSDYKAGLGIGEVGFDVSQIKEDKMIDITTIIKDTIKEMQNDQKTLIEVTRNLKDLGLLG